MSVRRLNEREYPNKSKKQSNCWMNDIRCTSFRGDNVLIFSHISEEKYIWPYSLRHFIYGKPVVIAAFFF